jgi:DNA polymerase III epsilon subunit-like protein
MERANPLVFVDVEVAGAEITRPVIQVAAIATGNNVEVLETFEAKLTFDERLADSRSLTRTRYSPDIWAAEARSATAVARAFGRFLRRHIVQQPVTQNGRGHCVAQLAAHNAPFDGPFLRTWFERVGAYFPGDYRLLCTMQRAQWLFQEHPEWRRPRDYKLGTLCDYFGVWLPPDQAHTALADVRATVEVYRRVWLLATAGIANRIGNDSLEQRPITRVACVAPAGQKTCRSRRRSAPYTCRSRRRRFRRPQS